MTSFWIMIVCLIFSYMFITAVNVHREMNHRKEVNKLQSNIDTIREAHRNDAKRIQYYIDEGYIDVSKFKKQ